MLDKCCIFSTSTCTTSWWWNANHERGLSTNSDLLVMIACQRMYSRSQTRLYVIEVYIWPC